MTAVLVLFLLFAALALAAVRWGADTRVGGEWRWAPEQVARDEEPPAPVPHPRRGDRPVGCTQPGGGGRSAA